MQWLSSGRDQWQLNVRGFNSLNNVTARGSDQESFLSRKISSTNVKKKSFSGKYKKWIFSDFFREKE